MHDLNSRKGGAGGFVTVKSHHGFDYFLNESAVLRGNVVKVLGHSVLHVAGEETTIEVFLDRYRGCLILIGCDYPGHGIVAGPQSLLEKPFG